MADIFCHGCGLVYDNTDWENGVLWERMRFLWKVLLLVVCYVSSVLSFDGLAAIGIKSIWFRAPILGMVFYVSYRGLFRLLRRGWFRWLLRKRG